MLAAKLSFCSSAEQIGRAVLPRVIAIGIVRQKGCGADADDRAKQNVERNRRAGGRHAWRVCGDPRF